MVTLFYLGTVRTQTPGLAGANWQQQIKGLDGKWQSPCCQMLARKSGVPVKGKGGGSKSLWQSQIWRNISSCFLRPFCNQFYAQVVWVGKGCHLTSFKAIYNNSFSFFFQIAKTKPGLTLWLPFHFHLETLPLPLKSYFLPLPFLIDPAFNILDNAVYNMS